MSFVVAILSRPSYAFLSLVITLILIVFSAWFPNLHLVTKTIFSTSLTFVQKTSLLFSLLGILQTNFSLFSRIILLASAVLFGIQVSLFLYFLRASIRLHRTLGVSFFGLFTSVIGIGCVSCGSVLLSFLIGFGSTAVVLGFLPFRGQEFGVIGVAVLLVSIGLTVREIHRPLACRGGVHTEN